MKNYLLDRVAFSLFGLDIYWYGLIITSAIVLCFVLLFVFLGQILKAIKHTEKPGLKGLQDRKPPSGRSHLRKLCKETVSKN